MNVVVPAGSSLQRSRAPRAVVGQPPAVVGGHRPDRRGHRQRAGRLVRPARGSGVARPAPRWWSAAWSSAASTAAAAGTAEPHRGRGRRGVRARQAACRPQRLLERAAQRPRCFIAAAGYDRAMPRRPVGDADPSGSATTRGASWTCPALLGDEAESLLNHVCAGVPREQLMLPGPGLPRPLAGRVATVRRPCCAASVSSTATGVWPTPATCRSCPSTRASSTRRRRRSPRTRCTSTRPTSSSWPSRAAATPSPPPSACSARSAASTPTASRSSSRSTTTSC